MIYRRRILDLVRQRIRTTPVVILEGPRTVGKSTLLRQIAHDHVADIVDLDETDVRHRVETDPQAYVSLPRPVLIDEYLKVPTLLEHIKAQLNKDGSPGQFVLTGSAFREANRSGLNALVGRHTAVPILPLAQAEVFDAQGNFIKEVFDDIESVITSGPSTTTRSSYIEKVLTGGFPLMLAEGLDSTDRYQRFRAYIDQSISYGLANLTQVREPEYLERLLHRYAAQTANLLNIQNAARDTGLRSTTAENYTRLLELLFIIYRLPAWKPTDRGPVSRPKLHVVDSGVAGRLLRLTSKNIRSGASPFAQQYGHILETFVVGEVRKLVSWIDIEKRLGHWRNRQGEEVDLVVERPDDGAVVGIEVKAASRVESLDWRGLLRLREHLGSRLHAGIVMYTGDMPYRLDEHIYAIPIDKLWAGEAEASTHVESASTIEVSMTHREGAKGKLLDGDDDPLREPVRAAAHLMIERMDIGKAAYWEVAVLPASPVDFEDFYSRAGVAGALRLAYGLSSSETESVGPCMAVFHERSPGGASGYGALVHPRGSLVHVVAAREGFSLVWSERDFIDDWSRAFAGLTNDVLSRHVSSWTYWSAGRRLQRGTPRFAGTLGARPGDPAPQTTAVVDDAYHKRIESEGDRSRDARLLRASFYEWFGIPARSLP